MNNKKIKTHFYLPLVILAAIATFSACKKYLPQERETVGPDSQFTTNFYQPVLGRTNYFSDNFFKGSTTYPATFTIVNARRRDGSPAPELSDVFPVMVWKQAYDGTERSIAEIEKKRQKQFRPLFEISPHSGELIMWAEARSSFVRAQPDSGYLFDVKVENSGGRRFYRGMKLMPFRERPYEPSNYNIISGQPQSNGVFPSRVSFVKGERTNRLMSFLDIDVYIRKLETEDNVTSGNTITFKFLDTLYNEIDPALFAKTDWQNLIHGFDMVKTDKQVTYKVAFPIPAVPFPTKYTTPDGTRARANFGYSRKGFGGATEEALFGLDFAIYEAGDWEIVFAFKNDNPKFSDD
jgi:hypothetical protein